MLECNVILTLFCTEYMPTFTFCLFNLNPKYRDIYRKSAKKYRDMNCCSYRPSLRVSMCMCYLGLAVFLDPAEDAGRELLKAADRHWGTEGLEQRVHDALKHTELHLIWNLLAALLRVILMGLHNVLIVPETNHWKHISIWLFFLPFMVLRVLSFLAEEWQCQIKPKTTLLENKWNYIGLLKQLKMSRAPCK